MYVYLPRKAKNAGPVLYVWYRYVKTAAEQVDASARLRYAGVHMYGSAPQSQLVLEKFITGRPGLLIDAPHQQTSRQLQPTV